MKRGRRFVPILALAAFVAVGLTLALAPRFGPDAEASHNGGSVALYSLDMNPTGNTINLPTDSDADTTLDTEQTKLGTIQNCIQVESVETVPGIPGPNSIPVDVVVQGWPASDPLAGYTIALGFPAGLSISRTGGNNGSITGDVPAIARTLLSADPQSAPFFFGYIDPPNYGLGADLAGPNTWDATGVDLSPIDADEDIDGEELSDGFLARVWFKVTAAGPALHSITLGGVPKDGAGDMDVTTVQGGMIAVDTPCVAPTPTPTPHGAVRVYALDMNPNNTPANSIDAPTDEDADTNDDTEQTTLSSIQNCIAVTHPATFPVDVVVQGWPPSRPLTAYVAHIGFPAGLSISRSGGANLGSITGHVPSLGRTLISADPQSGPFFPGVDAPNYGLGADMAGPNTWDAGVADFSTLDPDEDVDGEETSSGFLARVWFKTTAAGPALRTLTLGGSPEDDAGPMTVTTVQGGMIAVDTPCVAATPTPTPTPTLIAIGGIVELRTDPNAQSDEPASDSSLPLPASVAIGLLLLGAGGLYVVRMRRG